MSAKDHPWRGPYTTADLVADLRAIAPSYDVVVWKNGHVHLAWRHA
jgi:hypothetical protein